MAQLKDSVVQGSLRVTDTIYTNLLNSTNGIRLISQSSAFNDSNIYFSTAANTNICRIGANGDNGSLGIYAADTIILKPGSATTASTADGVRINSEGLTPIVTDTENLGTNTYKWANVYALTLNGNLAASYITGVLNPAHGGTGIDSYAKGDILYAGSVIANTSTTALNKLNIGTAGTALYATIDGPRWYGGLTLSGNAAASYIAAFAGTTDSTATNNGAVTIDGGLGVAGQVTAIRVGVNGNNTLYSLYVNGSSFHVGVAYFANGTTYNIDASGNATFNGLTVDSVTANTILAKTRLTVGNTALNTAYELYVNGSTFHTGTVYFANSTNYYIDTNAWGFFKTLTVYNPVGYRHIIKSAYNARAIQIGTLEGTSEIGSGTTTEQTFAQDNWGYMNFEVPHIRHTYATAGDITSTVTDTNVPGRWYWRTFSMDTSTHLASDYYENYRLPTCDHDRISNSSYEIWTTKDLTKDTWAANRLLYTTTTTNLATTNIYASATVLAPITDMGGNLGSATNAWGQTYSRNVNVRHIDAAADYTNDYNIFYGWNRATNHYFYQGTTGGGQKLLASISIYGIWAGIDADTTGERQVGVQSGAGKLYLYSLAATNGNRGLCAPAHGTGSTKTIIQVDTNNNITLFGNLDWTYIADCRRVHVDSTEDFDSYAWHQVCQTTITGAYQDMLATFLVTTGYDANAVGILSIRLRSSGTSEYQAMQIVWNLCPTAIDPNNFVLSYTTSNKKAILWCKMPSRWNGYKFYLLAQGDRYGSMSKQWSLYDSINGHGSASHGGDTNITSTVTGIRGAVWN